MKDKNAIGKNDARSTANNLKSIYQGWKDKAKLLQIKDNSKGKSLVPSKYVVYKKSCFGKISRDHSFTSEAAFDQVLIFLLKSEYLPEQDKVNLLSINFLYEHLERMIHWSKQVEFVSIRNPVLNYANQSEIDIKRRQKMLAALLYYDLDVPTLIRFLGGNYTGEYRDVSSTIKILQESNCNPTVINDLKKIFTIGCPNKLVASTSRENFLHFFHYGNHTSITKNIHKTTKALNKEDRNQFLIPLPCWLARFLKHLHITPQGLLMKKDKNDRMIWDGSFLPNWEAVSINMMLSHESEPEIVYGETFKRHLQYLYNFRISVPNDEILIYDDDVKSAFRHCKYHPDVASAFAFIIQENLWIPLGGMFGSIVTPANFEPIARARTHLAEFFSGRRDLLEKYDHIIDKVDISQPPIEGTVFTKATPCKFNQGLTDINKTQYNMFVDDSLFAQTRNNIKHAMAASIEALHVILGYPDLEIRQNPLSLDKYFESSCSYERVQLGITINTRKMTIGLTDKKRLTMIDELTHWHNKRRSFTLLQGVTLCGVLEFWANISPWVRFLYLNLSAAVNKCISSSLKITKENRMIKNLITSLALKKDLVNNDLRERFVQSKIGHEMYKCREKTFISNTMRTELKIIHKVLSCPEKYSHETPIAHIILREPDYISYGDASLEAGGGFAENLFWWHVEWPKELKSLTLKNVTITRRCKKSSELISINLLEFVVEIINYAALSELLRSNMTSCEQPFPMLINWTDNTTAQAWLRKAASRTIKGIGLQRILCSMMINNPLMIKAEYIQGHKNKLADAISRVFSTSTLFNSIDALHQEFPQMRTWMRFHPSQELLSALYLALLKGLDRGIEPLNNLGHFTQGKNIS